MALGASEGRYLRRGGEGNQKVFEIWLDRGRVCEKCCVVDKSSLPTGPKCAHSRVLLISVRLKELVCLLSDIG